MKKATFFASILMLVLFAISITSSLGSSSSGPKTIEVPTDYPTIQQAINAANHGDIVLVLSGVYHENVIVNKSVELRGENPNAAIINGGGTGIVVDIVADNVLLLGFSILNATYGIYLRSTRNSSARGNIIFNSSTGVALRGGKNNLVDFNQVISNEAGIALYNTFENVIQSNNVLNNEWHGISLWYSSKNNSVSNNSANNNLNGILLYVSCDENNIKGNSFRNNIARGIYVVSSDGNNMQDNMISTNNVGIRIRESNRNLLESNILLNNTEQGLFIEFSSENTVRENLFSDNSVGISLYISENNTIFRNNFITNQFHVEHKSSFNKWDYDAEGNYWDDYGGLDTNNDGIGDTAIPHLDVDRFPLKNPYISGDVNHDAKVDLKDLDSLGNSYGTITGGQNWNPHANSNYDNIIDVFDLIVVGRNFGKKWHFGYSSFGLNSKFRRFLQK